jgi:hypothetical protein
LTLTQALGVLRRPTRFEPGAWVFSLRYPRLFGVFAFLMVADWLVTVLALSHGAVEGNPAMAPLFDANPLVPLALKLGGIALMAYAVEVVARGMPRAAFAWLAACTLAMGAVVAWNVTVLVGYAA